MALPVIFGNLNSPAALSLLDTQSNALAALGGVPCACAGTNILTLTPLANTPTISGYTDLQPSFVFVAAQNSTGSLTANVALVGSRNVYKWNGTQQCGAGDIIAGNVYRLTPLQALNGGLGGFVCDAIGVNNNLAVIPFVIDAGGVAIPAGAKGFLGPIPWSGTIQNWTMIADQSGTVSVDILRLNNAVPVASIVGGGTKPNLAASQFAGQVAPSGWTSTTLVAGDMLGFSVPSLATSITRVQLGLVLAKS